MSDWSDEAVNVAVAAYYQEKRHTTEEAMRAALTAAREVEKREAGEKRGTDEMTANAAAINLNAEFIKLQSQVILLFAQTDRRLTALEAARPAETPKPETVDALKERLLKEIAQFCESLDRKSEAPSVEPFKPEPERRCGTCRWWRDELCHWAAQKEWPTGLVIRIQNLVQRPDEGTDCPTWEARS